MPDPLNTRFCVRYGCALRGRATDLYRCAMCDHPTELIADYHGSTTLVEDDAPQPPISVTRRLSDVSSVLRDMKGPVEDAFWGTPRGRARRSFQRGDQVLQVDFEVMSQQAIIVQLVGGTTVSQETDPTSTLNAVVSEGWELVTGSFVFVVQEEQSRDKFFTSGQNVAVKGATIGYYLFRRAEDNHIAVSP